ncbi:unnamed protein product, partial [Iphiclides podalirius]
MEALVEDLDHTTIYRQNQNYSEESDGEGGLGNLNRLIVRPPGHSGKAKRGHLCFDAAFECGNLGRADHVTELEYDLYLRPDTCRPRARFWFNFTVENVKQDQKVIFNIVNFGKEYTLYDKDMTPLVRSTSRQKWQRIPKRLLFYHKSLVHRGRKILSLAFGFDREEDVYQFAAAAPYSYSRLQKYLAIWEKRAQGFGTRETIAQTTQKRQVDLITIGDINAKDSDDKEEILAKGKCSETKKRVVIIIARSHGGEPPASYICQGLLDYFVSSAENACALRDHIVVPMLNPDGVFLGNQRSDLLGSDLNRCWIRATGFAHPSLVALKEHIRKISAEKVRFMSKKLPFERHAVLPKFLAMRVEAWQGENCLYNAEASLAGSARRALPTGAVDAYTLTVSMGGRRIHPNGPYIHYTEDAYAKVGRALVKALCDYYRHVGVVPVRICAPGKKEARGRRRRRRAAYERERSCSWSPERRVLAARVLSPALPPATPPLRALPPRPARLPRPRPTHARDNPPPAVTGTAVRTPRLAVVDLSAFIRTPEPTQQNKFTRSGIRAAHSKRHSRARAFTSDEYDTHESDS